MEDFTNDTGLHSLAGLNPNKEFTEVKKTSLKVNKKPDVTEEFVDRKEESPSASDSASTSTKITRKPSDYSKEDQRNERRKFWFGWLCLIMFCAGMFPFAVTGVEKIFKIRMVKNFMYATGIWKTPYDRLMAFYQIHEPVKANDKHVSKLLKKWRRKEEKLFQALENKYSNGENSEL